MEKKCSFSKHSEINAIYFCQECNIYMCKLSFKFLENHHNYELGKEQKEIFTSLCKEKNHSIKIQFYCQTHNQLCWAAYISKIKEKEMVSILITKFVTLKILKKKKEIN